jgi:hypothetical protein
MIRIIKYIFLLQILQNSQTWTKGINSNSLFSKTDDFKYGTNLQNVLNQLDF